MPPQNGDIYLILNPPLSSNQNYRGTKHGVIVCLHPKYTFYLEKEPRGPSIKLRIIDYSFLDRDRYIILQPIEIKNMNLGNKVSTLSNLKIQELKTQIQLSRTLSLEIKKELMFP